MCAPLLRVPWPPVTVREECTTKKLLAVQRSSAWSTVRSAGAVMTQQKERRVICELLSGTFFAVVVYSEDVDASSLRSGVFSQLAPATPRRRTLPLVNSCLTVRPTCTPRCARTIRRGGGRR